jgi:hypothetical protein
MVGNMSLKLSKAVQKDKVNRTKKFLNNYKCIPLHYDLLLLFLCAVCHDLGVSWRRGEILQP